MARAVLVLANEHLRQKAAHWLAKAPHMTRIEFKGPKRSVPQNSYLWALLTDIADQLTWYGKKLSADDWKLVMLDGLKRELRIVPNIDGTGFVNLGRSSSDLDVGEMADLLELIMAFGAQHGVRFHDKGNDWMRA